MRLLAAHVNSSGLCPSIADASPCERLFLGIFISFGVNPGQGLQAQQFEEANDEVPAWRAFRSQASSPRNRPCFSRRSIRAWRAKEGKEAIEFDMTDKQLRHNEPSRRVSGNNSNPRQTDADERARSTSAQRYSDNYTLRPRELLDFGFDREMSVGAVG